MMRNPSLFVIAFVFALSGNALAQQRLVQHNDQDDPCRVFKMRILIPADVDDRELAEKKFTGGIDSGMVWNPCPTPVQQIAFKPLISPHRSDILFPKSTFSFQSRAAERPRKPEEFLFAPPRFTFPRRWR